MSVHIRVSETLFTYVRKLVTQIGIDYGGLSVRQTSFSSALFILNVTKLVEKFPKIVNVLLGI